MGLRERLRANAGRPPRISKTVLSFPTLTCSPAALHFTLMSSGFVAARCVKHLDPPPSVSTRSGHTQTTVGKRVFLLAGIGGATGTEPIHTVDILDLVR